MNYEQKYKEALERARKLAIDGHLDAIAIHDIFPELKESEDEWIKDDIKDVIQAAIIPKENKREMLAWLEKQGKKLDADQVIEWIKTNGNLYPIVTIKINDVIARFKKDFGL